jgi:hypothetical protein
LGVTLSQDEFGPAVLSFRHTAFRLELQRGYREPGESETVAKFLAGEPEPPTEVEGLRLWFDAIRERTRQGMRIERVRVHEDPPTGYQRWERWIDPWNIAAGEVMRYLTRQRTHEIGLLPDVGDKDWWLLDSNRLILMRFDEQGNRIHNELETDPAIVVRACAWRDLAVHYSAPSEARSAVA